MSFSHNISFGNNSEDSLYNHIKQDHSATSSPNLLKDSGFSQEYVASLENHLDKSVRNSETRLKLQAKSNEKIRNALQNQLESLKKQLELTQHLNSKSLKETEDEYQNKLHNIQEDEKEAVQHLKEEHSKLTKKLSKVQTKTTQLSEEHQATYEKYLNSVNDLKAQIKQTQNEIDYHTYFLEETAQSKIKDLKAEINQLKENQNQQTLQLKRDHSTWMDEAAQKMSCKDTLIYNLECEIFDLREKISNYTETTEQDIQTMAETLKSTEKVLECQKQELKKLYSEHTQNTTKSSLLSKEAALLENELERTARENETLQEELKKLEDLVYGKHL